MAGPAVFRPHQHAGGAAAVQRQAQPQRGHVDPVPGGVGAQVRGSQAGAVLVQDAQRGPGRGHGAAAVAAGFPQQGLRVPGLGTLHRRPAAALGGGQLELGPGPAGLAPLESGLPGQQPGIEGGPGPARRGQLAGHALQLARARPGSVAVLIKHSQPGPQDRETGQHSPPGPALAAELTGRHPGLLQPVTGLALQYRRLGQQQPGLRQPDPPAQPLKFPHGLLGGLQGLAQEPDGQQQQAPVRQQLVDRHVVRAQALLSQVQVTERGWHLAPQGAQPAEVLVHEPE